jgi:hypothetical protein
LLSLSACGDTSIVGSCIEEGIEGIPDMPSSPRFNINSVDSENPIILTVSIDEDTAYVKVRLEQDDGTLAGTMDQLITKTGKQTLKIEIDLSVGVTSGDYYPIVTLCSSLTACNQQGEGIAVRYTRNGENNFYWRNKFYVDGIEQTLVEETCLNRPYLNVVGASKPRNYNFNKLVQSYAIGDRS